MGNPLSAPKAKNCDRRKFFNNDQKEKSDSHRREELNVIFNDSSLLSSAYFSVRYWIEFGKLELAVWS
jgi:hypothetical protein